MPIWTCEECGQSFSRRRAGGRPIRFCSVPCYHAYRKRCGIATGQFTPGFTPWNKGLKGVHCSPASEWKKGMAGRNWLPVGSKRVRHFRRTNIDRIFVKIAEPNQWREESHLVWEKHNGPIPKGLLAHHIDGNPTNNTIGNLALVSRKAHINLHRSDLRLSKQKKT